MSGSYLLTDLPSEILENVLSFLSYDEISKYRVVCRKFDTTCKVLLNHGFFDVERRHSVILKKLKSLLPRRESERKNHPLARHFDILTAIESRINMLRITYGRYMEKNVCCFIPGKVIDEILRILKIVVLIEPPPRTHEFLQELRDISSMAMEHFEEKVTPHLKTNSAPPNLVENGSIVLKLPTQDIFTSITFRKDFKQMQQQNLAQKKQISYLKDIVGKLRNKLKKQNNLMNHQTRKIREQSTKIKQQENSIAELKRHVEEWDIKFQDLVQNLNRSHDDLTKHPSTITTPDVTKTSIDTVGASSTPILYKSNIKPRKAQILTSRILSNVDITPLYDNEQQRKRKLGVSSSVSSIPSKLSRLHFLTNNDVDNSTDTELKNYRCSDTSLLKLPSFLTSGIETLLKSPITSIRSRKRKLQ